jgi:DNA repair protein RadA/Sms
MAFAAEVGLGGEIRPVHRLEQRINEAGKLGFDTVFCAKQSGVKAGKVGDVQVVPVARMENLVAALFG